MDTKKETTVGGSPTLKVARVGKERKRKGGIFSFLRSGGGRAVWTGATGGSGAGSAAVGAGLTFSKLMLIGLVSMTGLGAAGLGRVLGNASNHEVVKPKLFATASKKAAIKIEGDVTNLPGNTNTIPNSLGYLTGSKDGLTPEERAKKEADAAAAAEAQRVADEEAAKKAEAEKTAAAPAVDPKALLASAKADGEKDAKATAFGKKFGSLSSSMGGGSALNGGSGLSGGMNRQFGESGSMKKAPSGQLSAMKGSVKATTSRSSSPRLAGSKTKGFARKQLANANAYSRRGMAAGRGETASSDASSAFDNNPGAGTIISGPGISLGAKPQGLGDTATPNNGSGGDGSAGDQQGDCGAGQSVNSSGSCQDIETTAGKDAKPMLTMMANAVMALLLMIGVIAAMAISGPWGYWMAGVLVAMGAVITLLGVAMMAMGDYVTGGIATLTGGIVTYLAWGQTPTLTIGQGLIAGFGAPALMMVGKMLDKGNHKAAPEAAQQ